MNGVRSRGSERSREWTARQGDARHHVMIEPGVRPRQLQSEDRHVPPTRQIHRPLGKRNVLFLRGLADAIVVELGQRQTRHADYSDLTPAR